MIKVALIGSGTLAQHIAHYLKQSATFKPVGFFDDYQETGSCTAYGPILGPISMVAENFALGTFDQLLIGIGYNHLQFRDELFDRFSHKVPFATFIHETCYVDRTASVGPGTVLLPGCILDMHTTVAGNCFFNVACKVAHDSKIGASCFFGPGVNIAGFVQVGSRAFLGIGTTLINNITITSGIVTGGNSTITKSLDTPGLYVGTPASLVKIFQ
ncbi:acetyltransferase [Rufibacter roseus]|uniref:Acetyltransferase n=1 Tax=Rufibacter roseus TaxID=1567108 RepID=A0ABW2DLC5_9BACT|nr:acetyltransferase [Rufibacter roseus]